MKEIEKYLTELTSSDFWNKKDTKIPLSRTKIQTIVNNYLKKHNINIGTSTCFTYINNKNVVNLDLYPFKNSYISIYFEIKEDLNYNEYMKFSTPVKYKTTNIFFNNKKISSIKELIKLNEVKFLEEINILLKNNFMNKEELISLLK